MSEDNNTNRSTDAVVHLAGKEIMKIDRDILKRGDIGWAIVIADRGFVWVGETTRIGEQVYITNGYNIREWGTQRGLGELAIEGPKSETVLDYVPVVMVPYKAVIAVIVAERDAWKHKINKSLPAAMQHIDPGRLAETNYMGYTIVVADRGFVWVGDTALHGDTVYVTNGFNIREWGTQKGLGELAMDGPKRETTLDPIPAVTVPYRAVIALLPSNNLAWNKAAKDRR